MLSFPPVTGETRLVLRLLIDRRRREKIAVHEAEQWAVRRGWERAACLCGCGGFPRAERSRFLPGHDGDAVRWNRLPRNPSDAADPPRKSSGRKQMRTWSAEQLRTFLESDSVRNDRLFAAYRLAATTGMRRGEVLGLRWRDVDLQTSRVSVVQTLISVDAEARFSEPKTAKSRRSVPLDSETVTALREHRDRQELERLTLGMPPESELVFTQPTGEPVQPRWFTKAFERQAKKAGLPKIRLHDLRHTWATLALQAGLHPKVVSEILGHSSVSITLDVYSASIPTLSETAVAVVASLVAPSGRSTEER